MSGGQASSRKKFYKKLGVTVDLDKRLLILNGDITKETATVFYRALFKLQVESVEEPITIKIVRSLGGASFAGMAIYALLRACFAPVKGVVQYCAQSSACYIFQGASERIMLPGSTISLHWAVLPGCNDGWTIEDVAADYRCLSVVNDGLYNMIQRRTGMPMGAIKKLCKTAASINPRRAIQLGLADKIGGRKCRKNKKSKK